MMAYKNKTEGSFIEEKESSIIWNFKNTDFEFGQMQAKELRQQIVDVFQNFPIEIIETKFSIMVVPLELKKVSRILAKFYSTFWYWLFKPDNSSGLGPHI